MGRALGAVAVTLTVISIAAAYVLPIWATFGQRPAWKSSVRMLRGLWWGLPLIAASLAGVLACVSIAESEVEKERYQVEGDIRAGGELRGSALLAWDERNPPFEAASAIYGPSYLICNWYQERSELVVLVGTTAAAFLLWLLIAGVFAPPDKRKRLGRVLLAGTLALIELGSAVTLISLYTFNHIFRAYTPTSLLLHRLVWICSIGGTAIWVLIDLRRARAKSELLTDAGYTGGPAPDLGETGAKSRIKCG
jgi:hypothetical protein